VVEAQTCDVDTSPSSLGLFSIVGFPWLHHIQPLADVTMIIKACNFIIIISSIISVTALYKPQPSLEVKACTLL
jgi:hypothetical protein